MKKLTFKSYEELIGWCDSHIDDFAYWGHIENFNGYDSVEELKKEASPDWFDDGMTADVYWADWPWSVAKNRILEFFEYCWTDVFPLYEDSSKDEAIKDALCNDSPYFDDEKGDYLSWYEALRTLGGRKE